MGHSQSYDLRHPEFEAQQRDPVRGVRRVSKEHQTDTQYANQDGTETNFDYREDELRDRIRREQLRRREDELESLRIKQTETREPIIDAYRQPSPLTVTQPTYSEFNYYDHLKHHSPTDPTSYFVLKRRPDINGGQRLQFSPVTTVHTARTAPSTVTSRKEVRVPVVPVVPATDNSSNGYPNRSPVFSGRLSPLPRHPEVEPHPMPRYIPPMSHGTFSKTTMTSTATYVYRTGDSPQTKSPAPKAPRYDEVPVMVESPPPRVPKYDEVPVMRQDSPQTLSPAAKIPRYDEVPLEVTHLQNKVVMTPLDRHVEPKYSAMPEYRPATMEKVKEKPKTYSPDKYMTRRLEQSPLHQEPLQTEVRKIPFVPVKEEPRRVESTPPPVVATPQKSHRAPESPQHISEIHAEKRMIVGIDEMDPRDSRVPHEQPSKENVTYVTVVSNPDFPVYEPSEPLHRHPEVSKHPIYARPSQSTYEARHHPAVSHKFHNQETQYSRRPSEEVVVVTRVAEPQTMKKNTCHVENCTHVEVSDTPVVARRRVSQQSSRPSEKENRLTIFVDEEQEEKRMDDVVDLARDGDVGEMTSTPRRCFEEKLYYNSYIPTLSLGRRPVVSFYDKLH